MDRVTLYAEEILRKGEMGRLHRLACQRHLSDLERSESVGGEFGYYFDPKAAQRIISYAESLTVAEGFKPISVKLIGSQVFDLGCTFGWRRKDNGLRRFRRRYKSVARQNGKTFENGIMGTYIGGFSGYSLGKLFTVATKKRQARLAWEEMVKFINVDKDLSELFDVKDYKSLITCLSTGCTIEALSKEAGLDDGFRSIFASIDELHQHKDNSIYKAIYNGTRSLPETLVSIITTRGKDVNSFCKEFDDYCISILEGAKGADNLFCDIYSIDERDSYFDPNVWIKANPYVMTCPEKAETMKTDAQTAKDMGGSELQDFIVKSCNMWATGERERFAQPNDLEACAQEITLEDIRGCHVCLGFDFSSGGDLTTISGVAEFKGGVYIFSHSFMPRARFAEHIKSDLVPYDLWEQTGLITVTGGESDYINDYGFALSYARDLLKEYELKLDAIGIDPHNADGIAGELESFGVPVIRVTQSARFLNDATQELQLLIKGHNVYFDRSNELLKWSMANAIITQNSFGEKKVDKEPNRKTRRIDPVDAAIDAYCAKMKYKKVAEVDQASAIDRYMEIMGFDR